MKTMTMGRKGSLWGRWGVAALCIMTVGVTAAGCGGGGGGGPGPGCAPAALFTSWGVTANGQPVSCAQAGASEVDFIVDSMEVPFACSALSGQSPDFDAGTHLVSLELRDSSQNVLSKLGPMSVRFGCGEVVDLGGVEFSLTQ